MAEMKVRVKKTGEVLNVAEYAKVATDHSDGWGNPIEYDLDEIEIITDEPKAEGKPSIDWEQRRYEVAKEMLSTIKSSSTVPQTVAEFARFSIKYADELIKQLKGE